MDGVACFPKHFNAIRVILKKYRFNHATRSFPALLLEILEASIQLRHLRDGHTYVYNDFMDLLDDTTEILGSLSDEVSPGDFEKLNYHYSSIQITFSRCCAEAKKRAMSTPIAS